jgi:Domain of unknown function (DUF4421)
MKQKLFHIACIVQIILISNLNLFAQQTKVDTNYIHTYIKKNVIEISPGIYSTHFNFTNPGERKNNYRLDVNSSGYAGVYLNYKWLSLNYSFAMPGTQLDKNVKLNYKSFSFSFGERRLQFHPFYDSYNGLLIPEQKHKDSFEIFRGITFRDAGIDLFYYTNSNHFSFYTAQGFSEQQMKSSGSVFLMATPLWQKVNWKNPSRNLIIDSTTYTLLSQEPQWASFIARVGYIYNFSFQKGKWCVIPAVLLGAGWLRELNTPVKKLKVVTDIQTWLKAGYNGPDYYFYFNSSWDNLQTNLFIKNLHQVNSNFSITAGIRFQNFKKKIFKIL